MKRWSENFLDSVCQTAVMEAIPTKQMKCINFDAKLKRLKANVILSNFIDRDEFEYILWDDMVDKSTECNYLKKIRHNLDIMASTPMGKEILSGVLSSTYFGVAPMNKTGCFFDRSCPMIFLRASDDIFRNDKLVLRVLAHECMHASNVEMEDKAHAYLLSPRLSFMKNIMNEMSAYLSEDIVVKQIKNSKATTGEHRLEYAFGILEQLTDHGYVDEFAKRTIKWHRNRVLNSGKENLKEQNLTVFANYFTTHPVLCNLSIIDRLYQLYQTHVVKKFHHQRHIISHQHKR